jgi:nicotinamide-nucleotide amidase
MQAYIITIGDELLLGQTIDTNSAWIGTHLGEAGVEVVGKITVGDDTQAIIEALNHAMTKAELIITTGGLGPTKDDITKKSIAEFLGREMYFDDEVYARIKRIFEKIGRNFSDSHREQCFFPTETSLLKNNNGTAPGMLFHYKGRKIISLPGVPAEMKGIFINEILPMLINDNGGVQIVYKTLITAGVGETYIEDKIRTVVHELPSDISMAYLPSYGTVRLRVTGKHHDKKYIEQETAKVVIKIKKILGDLVLAEEDISLEELLLSLCTKKNITLATAESCTGGLVANKIVGIPGASACFNGSIVAYSNELKMSLLHVSLQTLETYGAVSEACVREMLAGLLQSTDADVGVAISGIAGPEGGTDDKPVGTVWIAAGNKNVVNTRMLRAFKNRKINIEYSANMALYELIKFSKGI